MQNKTTKILSIETSCDDTGISILEARSTSSGQEFKKVSFRILANSSNSQIKIHAPYGGVYPSLAKREHIKNLPILLERSLKIAKLSKDNKPIDPIRVHEGSKRPSSFNGINLIAVTSGPGLEPALWAGILFAKDLAKKWKLPLVPVNHMEGHILSVFGKKDKFSINKIKFPALSLLVSGGHTELVLIKENISTRGGSAFGGKYQVIGETLDDAVGEAFDKVARMLGLPYPGGPEISKLAELERKKRLPEAKYLCKLKSEKGKQASKGVRNATGAILQQFSSKKIAYPEKFSFPFSLPRPMLKSPNFDFSFSGLKTAVLYLIRDIGPLNENKKRAIALEFENAVVETLIYKTKKAIEKYKAKTLIVAGGVSANKFLKKEIKKMAKGKTEVLFPNKNLTGDNAIMIGIVGYLKFLEKKEKVSKNPKIKAEGGLRL